jgi:hypothetical protein
MYNKVQSKLQHKLNLFKCILNYFTFALSHISNKRHVNNFILTMLPLPLYFHSPPCSFIFQILFDGFHYAPFIFTYKRPFGPLHPSMSFLNYSSNKADRLKIGIGSASNLFMSQIYTFCECLNLVKSHEFFYKVITLW